MKVLLKLEYAVLFGLGLYLFSLLEYGWEWLAILILVPDVSMVGYLVSPKLGAITYNLVHNFITAALLYGLGLLLATPVLMLAGVVTFAHIAMDRLLGFGLKYSDRFTHTHLSD